MHKFQLKNLLNYTKFTKFLQLRTFLFDVVEAFPMIFSSISCEVLSREKIVENHQMRMSL